METYRATLCAALVTVFLHSRFMVAESEVVRLVGGDTPYEGRVEMFIEDEWLPVLYYGSIRGQSWSFTAADILCNELGYKGAMSYGRSRALSGDPRRRITDIRCDENHQSLMDCDFVLFDFYDNAATVKCNYDAYLGCYSGLGRYLPSLIYSLTIQHCLERCRSDYYTYAGLHDGWYCLCYNEAQYTALTKESGDKCLTVCNGDGRQTCGGDGTVGIYLVSMGSCGGHMLGTGTIYSPGFPGYYAENQECTWHVSAQPRSILEFKFVLFNVDQETDSVTLYERMNGRQRNIEVSTLSATSCSNTVDVTFQSGINGGTHRGIFTLKYREVPLCPLLPSRVNGTLHYNGSCPYLIGDTVSITCKTGFKLSSPHHTVECQQNATWNGTLPVCIAIDCGNPGEVENADRIGTQYSYNRTVIYTCHDGYYTNGSGTIRCTIEGLWTEKPSCYFNHTQLSESVTTSHAGWAIGVSLGAVTAILIGLALIIFLMRRKIRLKFRNALGSSSAIQDEVIYCNEPDRRNNIRREGAVNSENLKVISEDDGYTSVDTDQTEDHGCIDKQTGVKMLVKPLAQYETSKQNGTKVDIMLQNDKIRSNKYKDESQRYDNLIIGEKVGERSFTCDSGSVENVAYESADINDDDGDVYTAIDEDGDVSMADNVDVGLVHHTARNDGEGTVDNIAYETVDSIDHGRPAYAVRDGT